MTSSPVTALYLPANLGSPLFPATRLARSTWTHFLLTKIPGDLVSFLSSAGLTLGYVNSRVWCSIMTVITKARRLPSSGLTRRHAQGQPCASRKIMLPSCADDDSANHFHDPSSDTDSSGELPPAYAIETLSELHCLLREYAPVWFTKRHDDRINSALRDSGTSLRESLHEIFHLLEEYAPAWYQPEHHEKAKSALRLLNKSPMSSMQKSTSAGSQG